MSYSAGLSRLTGHSLSDWDHVVQSIALILTTPLGSRVMRRDFGSELMELVDRPMTDKVILAVYAATAIALEPRLVDGHQYGEPRFRLKGCSLVEASAEGRVSLRLTGLYMPRGHVGDFTVADSAATASILLAGIS